MSQIRTAKAADLGAFPGSTFVIDGSPPIAQCQETQITSGGAFGFDGLSTIELFNAFIGIDLTAKQVTITLSNFNDGTYDILSNTDSILTVDYVFQGDDFDFTIAVKDPGQAYLTRNESSFQRFIESKSKAHTTKGGQLYTDLADPPMDDACSDTWSPE